MKKLMHLLLVLATSSLLAQNAALNLIPQPVEIQQNTGAFILTKSTTIGYDKAEAKTSAEMLARHLNTPTGFALSAKMGSGTANIQLNLNATPNDKIGKEGYTFESTTKGVTIAANQPAGLFYGMQTLLQLLPKEIESQKVVTAAWTVPAVRIRPLQPKRG